MLRFGSLVFYFILQLALLTHLTAADSQAAPALAGTKGTVSASPLNRTITAPAAASPPYLRPVKTYTLSGYITDPSGAPRSGAVIVTGNQQQISGTDGAYRLGGFAASTVTVKIFASAQDMAARHSPRISENLTINADTRKDYAFATPDTGTLRGRVIDASTGAPLAGVAITINKEHSTISRNDGGYSVSGLKLDNPHSKTNGSTVAASKAGYTSRQEHLFISKDTVLDIGMAPVGTVQKYTMEGYVVDPSDVPFSGAVLVTGNQKQLIGPDGAYRVTDLVLGGNIIRIYANMQQLVDRKMPVLQDMLNITGNSKRNFTLTLPNTATLKGTIRDAANGTPIPAATITVKGKSILTGAAGGYSVSSIPLDSYDPRGISGQSVIAVSKPGYISRQVSMYILRDTPLDLGLEPSGSSQSYTLAGNVTDPSGVPLNGAIIVLYSQSGKQQLTIGPDGRYSFSGLKLGNARVDIYPNAQELANRHAPKLRDAITINGNTLRNFILAIPNTGTLRGKVLDRTTGSPVSGATITVGDGQGTTTKADGSYSVSGLKIDNTFKTYSKVRVVRNDYKLTEEYVSIKKDTEKDFMIDPAAR